MRSFSRRRRCASPLRERGFGAALCDSGGIRTIAAMILAAMSFDTSGLCPIPL
jgi:hypothetical protein